MNNEDLKKITKQIKKYNLTEAFSSTQELDKWLSKLNQKQTKNFISLIIDPSSITFPKNLLLNDHLLNCDDYTRRIDAMAKLKNGKGCLHLFERLCSPNFLNSKNYYQDMEMLSKAGTARYVLWIINDDNFIKSKYHDEDLKFIVEARDIEKDNEKKSDNLVAEALATVAGNIDSIKSPYHKQDMELIARSGSKCLQMSHSYPEHSLNNLAINKVSLNDKYHLENMQILAKNPTISKYLYNIMTNPHIVKGKNYRAEVDALVNAKSEITAAAIYFYIVNPQNIIHFDFYEELYDLDLNIYDINYLMNRDKNIKGNSNPRYLENLKLLNQVDDKFVMHFESLMSNSDLLNSKYYGYDLNFLLTIKNKDIFMDLYQLMTNEDSLSGDYHINDVNIISRTANSKNRKLLLFKARNEHSINSNYHLYDMQYIANLDLEHIDEEIYNKMYYYLFEPNGMDSVEHIDKLERLYNGELVENRNVILEHLNNLDDTSKNDKNVKILSKIKSIFKK